MGFAKKEYIEEIHSFRGIAIFLIVSSHLLYDDRSSVFYSFISSIYLDSTLFFTFISGYLFYYNLEKYDFKSYLRKKFNYVIIPYIIISIPALLLRYLTGPSFLSVLNWPDVANKNILIQIGYYLSNGSHLIPLWYIPMITLFFLAAPIFKMFKKYKILFYSLPILLIMTMYFERTLFNFNNIPHMAGHFLFAYVFGMWYSENRSSIEKFVTEKLKILLVILLILFLTSLKLDFNYRSQLLSLQKLISIPIIIVYLKKLPVQFKNLFDKLAETSFGIYFVHFYIILALRILLIKIFETEYPNSPHIWVLVFLATIIGSYFVIHLLKKMTGKQSRYVIGS